MTPEAVYRKQFEAHMKRKAAITSVVEVVVAPPAAPQRPVHQVYISIPAPPRGFLAYQMAWHKRTEAA